jgi:hypothetical protein
MNITKLAPLLLHHAPASYVPSADILCLTVVPINGKRYGHPVHIDVDPSTTIIVMHNLICDKLRTTTIGEFYRKPLEILPLRLMLTLEQLKGEDPAELCKEALQPDSLPDIPVVEWFKFPPLQGLNAIHFVVWLPVAAREFLCSNPSKKN